ncbi:SPOR domain-containing protein [Mesobacterium pallidum]|uniref:SPOR domain-containing protein n=1 Tax=Mesobacterium pallidum TaxID=2872037 RepID=UPI001EE2E1EE|nr:SPOR domain-containing protein [Mesobacterium pallidum]
MKPTQIQRRTAPWRLRAGIALVGALALAGCEEGGEFNLFQKRDAGTETAGGDSQSTRLVERDVEAPDVFQVTEAGLWDGRPSLGGVWVAYPDVTDPERVIIRNTANGKFVIGALFRRERESTGPRLQVSSDAAAALGMLAGKPNNLNVTALRREEVEQAPDPAEAETTETVAAPAAIASAALDPVDPAATAAAAIDAAPEPAAVTPVAAPAPKPAATPKASSLDKPYLQIGIFSVEQNANDTAESMRQNGMVPTVKKSSSSGKTFWRVLVGPAQSSGERTTLLNKIKGMGFTDAYAVSN